MVLAALTCAAWMATSVAVPRPIPDFALRAEEIYRLEVGTAFFLAFYLVAMAFVLALSGKGFAEFGTRGLKATDVVDQQQKTLLEQRNIDRHVQKQVREFRTTI